jgi:hypothetical protein
MEEKIVERTVNNIKVTLHIPEDVSNSTKINRINQIYDILTNFKSDNTDEGSNAKVSATARAKSAS